MVHRLCLKTSEMEEIPVSCVTCPQKSVHGADSFVIHGPKSRFRAMQQHPQVILADVKPLAQVRLVALLEEKHAQECAVHLRQFFEYAIHLPPALLADQGRIQ